jgi:aldehyde:ferredoxin oxidoreductase
LTGGYVESQVGGGFAARLVAIADALVLRGRLGPSAGRVLVLDRHGAVRVETRPELLPLDLPERAALLRAAHPEASGLCVGRAGEGGVRFANLATIADPPSFTGRGGLGARLGATGLTALLVEGDERPEPTGLSEWTEALARSPHLRARGAGGTFELLEAFAARGDLPADPSLGGAFAERLAQRQSCPGCPTACRHVLRVGERRLAGRFSATFPLGVALGVTGAQDALELLEACNAVGVDAAEMGAALVVSGELRGDLQGLSTAIRCVASTSLARGAQALADELGKSAAAHCARGSAVRPVRDLAALLGQCVSARGSDPMRAFPFLSENGGDEQRLARLLAPLELPAQAFDPGDPAGKGRLVWWHENLANVLDASGFCAFSAAGLVGDGFADLDDLAGWLALPGLEPSAGALLAAGATLALLQREIAERRAAPPDADRPAWARERLDRPGMWDEYRVLRGLDLEGRIRPEVRQRIGTLALARWGQDELERIPGRVLFAGPPRPVAPGRLELSASGLLAQALGDARELLLELPRPLSGVLRELAARRPAAAPWLGSEELGDGAVAVYCDGRRLFHHDWVLAGDRLDLVVAISGG